MLTASNKNLFQKVYISNLKNLGKFMTPGGCVEASYSLMPFFCARVRWSMNTDYCKSDHLLWNGSFYKCGRHGGWFTQNYLLTLNSFQTCTTSVEQKKKRKKNWKNYPQLKSVRSNVLQNIPKKSFTKIYLQNNTGTQGWNE